MTPKAIVLFSGGLDSTTTLAIAKNAGYDLFAMSFNYGQRHKIEIEKAKVIAENMGVKEHHITNSGLEDLKLLYVFDADSFDDVEYVRFSP